jgi:hypothetical protein
MDELLEFLKSTEGFIVGGGVSLAAIGSFVTNITTTIKNIKLKKKEVENKLSEEAKNLIIKKQQEEIALFQKEIGEIKNMVNFQNNVVTASFMDSGVSRETKEYIATEASKLKNLVPETKEVVSEKIDAVLTKKDEVTKEIKDTIDNVKNIAEEKIREIGEDTLDLYNKILNKQV